MSSGAVLSLSSRITSPLLGRRNAATSFSRYHSTMQLPAAHTSPSSHPTTTSHHLASESTPAFPLIPPPASSATTLPSSTSFSRTFRSSYVLGLVYLGVVILLWVLSGALIQWIFEQQDEAQPFFLTYFCTSLFTLYIPTYFALQQCRRMGVYQRITPEGGVPREGPTPSPLLSMREHLHFAFLLSPIWFLMEFLYNESLALTTLSQNTILSTTSGVFVLAFNWFIFRDPLTATNLLGVLFTLAGAYLVYHDGLVAQEVDVERANATTGDVLAVLAALFYGLYTVTVKLKVKDDEAVNWQLILGFLGLINLVVAWPFFFVLDLTGIEPFALPPPAILGSLLLNGVLGTVLADYLWARSILLTSPLVATMGLTLNIPFSLLVEWIWKGREYGWTYVVGGLSVVVGFVLVNWKGEEARQAAKAKEEAREEEEEEGEEETELDKEEDDGEEDEEEEEKRGKGQNGDSGWSPKKRLVIAAAEDDQPQFTREDLQEQSRHM